MAVVFARPTALLVQTANQFASDITLEYKVNQLTTVYHGCYEVLVLVKALTLQSLLKVQTLVGAIAAISETMEKKKDWHRK